MGVADLGLTVGAVCVYPTMVPAAVQALLGQHSGCLGRNRIS